MAVAGNFQTLHSHFKKMFMIFLNIFSAPLLLELAYSQRIKISECCIQKQSSRVVLRKRCSENMQQINWRTPMPESDLMDFLQSKCKATYWNHTSAWVFPENLLHIFRTPFRRNTFGELLLWIFSKNYLSIRNSGKLCFE